MALFEYFPNYIWNLSLAIALESGAVIGEGDPSQAKVWRWRPGPESNRRARICSPLRHHSAIGPQALEMRGVSAPSRFARHWQSDCLAISGARCGVGAPAPPGYARGSGSPGWRATVFVPVDRAQIWNSSSEAT